VIQLVTGHKIDVVFGCWHIVVRKHEFLATGHKIDDAPGCWRHIVVCVTASQGRSKSSLCSQGGTSKDCQCASTRAPVRGPVDENRLVLLRSGWERTSPVPATWMENRSRDRFSLAERFYCKWYRDRFSSQVAGTGEVRSHPLQASCRSVRRIYQSGH
jgi:hypothetical protein